MSGGAVVTIARNSVVALAFLFIFLASTCVGFLQFPFLTVNGPRLWVCETTGRDFTY